MGIGTTDEAPVVVEKKRHCIVCKQRRRLSYFKDERARKCRVCVARDKPRENPKAPFDNKAYQQKYHRDRRAKINKAKRKVLREIEADQAKQVNVLVNRWITKNPELSSVIASCWCKRHPEFMEKIYRLFLDLKSKGQRSQRSKLETPYILVLLKQKGFEREDISEDLIELHRATLKLKRAVKEIES